ncbi:unnamed protein product, partial [Polarella glacialis]
AMCSASQADPSAWVLPASQEEREAAARALCPALLWPSRAPAKLKDLVPGQVASQASVPPELARALKRRRPEVLAYRFLLVLLEVGASTTTTTTRTTRTTTAADSASAKPDECAFPQAVSALRVVGFVVRDALSLRDEVDGQRLLLLLQPPSPLSLAEAVQRLSDAAATCASSSAALCRLHPAPSAATLARLGERQGDRDDAADVLGRSGRAEHWRRTNVEAVRRFPELFRPRSRLVVVPPSTAEELQQLQLHFLLHGHSVRAVVHPLAKAPAAGERCAAAFALRGFGALPAADIGELGSCAASGSCALGLPAGSRSFKRLAAAKEANSLTVELATALGLPPPQLAPPKAAAAATVSAPPPAPGGTGPDAIPSPRPLGSLATKPASSGAADVKGASSPRAPAVLVPLPPLPKPLAAAPGTPVAAVVETAPLLPPPTPQRVPGLAFAALSAAAAAPSAQAPLPALPKAAVPAAITAATTATTT